MFCGWAKASACRLQIALSCAFLCHIVSLQYLSRSSLHSLAGLPCRIFLSYGLQVVTREVHRSSLRRLICPAQDHFIFLTVLIISMTFVLSLTQMLDFLSLYVMLSILLSILVCAAASLFCACLVSVQVSLYENQTFVSWSPLLSCFIGSMNANKSLHHHSNLHVITSSWLL